MELDKDEEKLLRSVALQNARAVLHARERAERELIRTRDALEAKTEELVQQREWFQVTLSSIGDAVITTDLDGKVTFLNPVAEAMTGWKSAEAIGQPLETVFNIINEQTRQPAVNPITKVLRDGVVVGLANHTALVAKDGTETAIEDSAAPIKDATGKILGAVMVFHDVTRRRKAEEALRESENRKSAILDVSLDAIITMDHEGKISDFNPAAERMFGYSRETAVGRQLAELIIPERYRKRHYEGLARYLATGQGPVLGKRIEMPALHAKGHEFPTELSICRITGIEPPIFTATLRDITESKQAELKRERLTSVLERSLNEIYIFDTEHLRFQYVNEGARRNLGYSMDEMRELTPLDLKPEFTEASFREMVKPLLSGEKEKHIFYTVHRRKDGTLYPVEVHLQSVTHLGEPVFLAVILDITERRQSEEAKFRLAAVVESSVDAIISTTLEGIITSWNRGAELMYGYAAGEVSARPVTILIPPDRVDEESGIIERLKRGEKVEHYETVRLRKDGTLLDVALAVSPIKDAEGRIVGASTIARDITERKRAEAELRKAREELEQRVLERTASLQETTQQLEAFCYTIAHDLRSPLRAQQSFAQVLLEDYKDALDPTGREYAQRIINSARRLDRLVDDLLTYSRLSRSEVKFENVDMGKVLRDVQTSLAQEINNRKAEISSEPLLPVSAYLPTLQLVITNLISNALKFAKEGERPQIRIWSESQGGSVRLWVEDNGIGISPEHTERIFGVFERLHPMDKYPGTGIGLAIVHKGVERMGGRAGVESEPGQGSRFWIELPRAR